MIAPSPDWFVGINSLPLRENGEWIERIERELSPYDAGTDDGVTFQSDNANSSPQDAIQRILVSPFQDPTPQIASPRRGLAIRGGDDKIEEGLQQNDTKVNR